MTEKVAGTIAVLAVVFVGGYFIYKGLSDDFERSPVSVNDGGAPVAWAFDPAGTDATDAPLTSVSIIWEGKTFDAGTHQGNCFEVQGSGWELVEGERTGVICWWAGGGVELGVFEESGELVVKRGQIDEGTAEEPGMRGGFETLFVLKKTGDSVLLRARLTEEVRGLGISLTPLEVLEDSRCPAGVTCIQAGTVRVRTQIEVGGRASEHIFTLGIVETRERETLTLVAVEPAAVAGGAVSPGAYRFTFGIEKRATE